MTEPPPQLNPDTGLLSIGDAAFAVFEQLAARGQGVTAAPGSPDQMARLRSASVLDREDRFHPSLNRAVAVIGHAEAELVLTWTERVARVWVASDDAALLLPDDDNNLRQLTYLPVWVLPETVSRIVGLGPRPRPAGQAVPVVTLPADKTRSRWTLSRIATGAGRSEPIASLEVVDTAAGLWVVEPGDRDPTASPSDPTAVWRAIIRLVRGSGTALQGPWPPT